MHIHKNYLCSGCTTQTVKSHNAQCMHMLFFMRVKEIYIRLMLNVHNDLLLYPVVLIDKNTKQC